MEGAEALQLLWQRTAHGDALGDNAIVRQCRGKRVCFAEVGARSQERHQGNHGGVRAVEDGSETVGPFKVVVVGGVHPSDIAAAHGGTGATTLAIELGWKLYEQHLRELTGE